MADDEWDTVALPVMEYIHANLPLLGFLNVGTVAEGTGIDGLVVARTVDRLRDAGYLTGGVHRMATGGDPGPWFIEGHGLAERGLRTVGAWPSDNPYEALLTLIERQIAATTDEPTRTKLDGLKASLASVGQATVSGILVKLATSGIH